MLTDLEKDLVDLVKAVAIPFNEKILKLQGEIRDLHFALEKKNQEITKLKHEIHCLEMKAHYKTIPKP